MEGNFAPYAPPAAVIGVIRHYTQRDVPERITTTNLMQVGVTESLVPRTVAALRFLGLLREDMTTTDSFRALRFANEDEYHDVLGRTLDAAYKDVFDHIDVSMATDREINNAFIPYSPGGQRGRMITLFLALCREAGWQVAASTPPKTTGPRGARKDPKPAAKRPSAAPQNSEPITGTVVHATTREHITGPSVFAVTDADFTALPDDEFDTVWAALGMIQKARAKAARERADTKEATEGQ